MRLRYFIVLTILLLFFFTDANLLSQSSDSSTEDGDARTVCVFDLVNATEGEDREVNAQVGALFSDTLAIELELKGYNVLENQLVREEIEEAGLTESDRLDKDKALSFAKDLGADIVVTGFFRVSNNEVLTGIKVYDIPSGQIASALTEKGPAGLQIFDEIEGIALSVSSRIREALAPYASRTKVVEKEKIIKDTSYEEVIVELGTPSNVTLFCPTEGAEVYLGRDETRLLGVITDGKVTFESKVGKDVVLKIVKEGRHTRTITRSIKKEEEEIKIVGLWKKTRFDLSASWSLMVPFGLSGDFRFHIIPDYLFAYGKLGAYYIPGSYYIDTMFNGIFSLWGRLQGGIGGYLPVPAPPFPLRLSLFLGIGGEFFYLNQSAIIGDIQMSLSAGMRLELHLPDMSFFAGVQICQGPILAIIPRENWNGFWFWEVGATWKL